MRGEDLFVKKSGRSPGPISLGNPVAVTIRELAEPFVRLTDSRFKTIFKPLPTDDPDRRKRDVDVARSRLSWEPMTDLAKGLSKTIDYSSHGLAPEGVAHNA